MVSVPIYIDLIQHICRRPSGNAAKKKRKIEKEIEYPEDIKSIDVLKGEAARAKGYNNSHGAIIIKTKDKRQSSIDKSDKEFKVTLKENSEQPEIESKTTRLIFSPTGKIEDKVAIPPKQKSPEIIEPKPPLPEQPPVENNIIDGLTLFPNPAKSSMKVRYELENDGRVNIGIYDISGERLETIEENVFKKAGSHIVNIGETLKNLPRHRSYIIKLQTEKMTISKQFLLEN